MELTLENQIYVIIAEYENVIEINKDICHEDYFLDMINNLLNKCYNNLDDKRINLLEDFGNFINTYDIDIHDIDKSILDEIHKYHGLDVLKIIASSEEKG